MGNLAERRLGDLVRELAARTPTPGGGAAAAATAALGCSAGAMAARYTTGAKWADRSATATALAEALDVAGARLLALADEDEAAFAAAQAARKSGDALAQAAAEQRAMAVPLTVLELCASQATALAAFIPLCNPQLLSDVRVGIHLLAGAGRAAWATVLAGSPDAASRTMGGDLLTTLAHAEGRSR
jgi:formiminotetrahydrofolate cyclodeaminase